MQKLYNTKCWVGAGVNVFSTFQEIQQEESTVLGVLKNVFVFLNNESFLKYCDQVFDRVVQDKPVCPRLARLWLSPLITVLVLKHPPLIESTRGIE